MKKHLFFIIIIFAISCKRASLHNDISNLNKVDLSLTQNKNIAFNPLYNQREIFSLKDRFPKYYSRQLKVSNISSKDSTKILTWNLHYYNFIFSLYKDGFIGKEHIIKRKIDSTVEVLKPKQQELLFTSKFSNNKQIITFDANYNNDFSDDKPISFNLNSNIKTKEIPTFNFKYWNYKDQRINYFNRKFSISPSKNRSQNLNFNLADYWHGEIKIDKNKYDIAIQGFYSSFLNILIKHKSQVYDSVDYTFNENFEYKLKDTIKLSNQFFVLDSISNDLSNIFLKPTLRDKNYGHRIGETIANFNLDYIKGNKVHNLYQLTKNKKLTLLDFWGTWCKPCIKTIPELKYYNTKFKDKVNLVSIAFDKEKEKVNTFITENKMDWNHFFYDRKDRANEDGIIRSLRIKHFPTLLILDSNNKIIYRGVGKENLEKINNILSNY